ncbi:uncharacterized protein A1O5_11201 [Cladophialophora psammophila CBS 110553]|uniref:Uncharacterized protein n=1 Tax=Cladophialophora psammophila CBS 110553 TaxID=1182543 RepID=W9X5E1_9EURO|nr:uncharacterized protein A1O5_11201 [Cladophialophora psammophila CBS 110553]EXJ65674.1 hypothetical protein A1O5_11201 [Cladophialophora psammophila CBS 110553]
MVQPPFFHVDHVRRDIEALTVAVHEPVRDNGEGTCIKSAWLTFPEPERVRETASESVTEDDKGEGEREGEGDRAAKDTSAANEFPVLLSAGEGIIIHYDLWAQSSSSSRSAIYAWKDHRTGKSSVAMPSAQNAAYDLDIVGGTHFCFVLKEWHSWGFLRLNVKCLVTTSELPAIQPNYSDSNAHHNHTRPLMWIGVGTDTNASASTGKSPSLVQLAYRVGGMHQGSKPAYWVHKDDDGVEMI